MTKAFTLWTQKPSDRLQLEVGTCQEHPSIVTDFSKLVGPYGCFYVDPPWSYSNQSTRGATDGHYDGLSVSRMIELFDLASISAAQAHLHLWTTNAFLFDCARLMDAWGFEFKSSFVWVKKEMGMGNYWRNSHEMMLLGVRGGLVAKDHSLRSWYACSRGEHSQKPDKIREYVQAMSPGPYLEIFGRRPVEGWDVYGNQQTQML